jgi:hypothetical protein
MRGGPIMAGTCAVRSFKSSCAKVVEADYGKEPNYRGLAMMSASGAAEEANKPSSDRRED